ncbi:MAG: FtsW/RodA/SpoVE family cell cycle protein [Hyphomicrobiaceae bacterium]
MKFSRADESRVAGWWFTVDHLLLTSIVILAGFGVILSLAASPEVAIKKGLPTFYFFERHLFFSGLGLLAMTVISFLSPLGIRRLALGIFLAAFAGLVWVALAGSEINGARRWLNLGGYSLQPSEFIKPAFVVLCAWLFAQARQRTDMPAFLIAICVLVLVAGLLIGQPDIGQTLLIVMAWGSLFTLSGQSILGVCLLAGSAVLGLGIAYLTLPHVAARFNAFFSPSGSGNSQLDRAMQSFVEGGFFGRGPGEGTIKSILPDAHTDFIFAVVAEEYGVVACLVLLALFSFITLRTLLSAGRQSDLATRLAIQGLALIFGFQALINMGVNVGLLPAKGMTLPFISAGGSSLLAVCITLGMLLALTRRRPTDTRHGTLRSERRHDVSSSSLHPTFIGYDQ